MICISVGSGERLRYALSQSFMLCHLINAIAYLSNVNWDPFLLVGEFRTKVELNRSLVLESKPLCNKSDKVSSEFKKIPRLVSSNNLVPCRDKDNSQFSSVHKAVYFWYDKESSRISMSLARNDKRCTAVMSVKVSFNWSLWDVSQIAK